MRIRRAIPVLCAPRSTKVSCAGSNWLRDAGLLGQLPVKELIGDLYFCIKLIQRIITNTQNKIKTNSVGVTRQRSNSSTKHVGRRSKAGSTDPQQLGRKLSMDMPSLEMVRGQDLGDTSALHPIEKYCWKQAHSHQDFIKCAFEDDLYRITVILYYWWDTEQTHCVWVLTIYP